MFLRRGKKVMLFTKRKTLKIRSTLIVLRSCSEMTSAAKGSEKVKTTTIMSIQLAGSFKKTGIRRITEEETVGNDAADELYGEDT